MRNSAPNRLFENVGAGYGPDLNQMPAVDHAFRLGQNPDFLPTPATRGLGMHDVKRRSFQLSFPLCIAR